jgi:hypothetical protein
MNKFNFLFSKKIVPLRLGKSYTVSSLRTLQGLTAAKVVGRSDAM